MAEKNFGFAKSKIDGSEKIYVPSKSEKLPDSYSYKRILPNVLNQGSDPICVPCSLSTFLNWRENIKNSVKTDNEIDYFEIYDSKKSNGEGMTFKEAFSFLRHKGVSSDVGKLKIGEYALVKSVLHLKQAIIANGPCFGALPVYNYEDDFWNKYSGDKLLGYHAIAIVGYTQKGFIIRNSWGRGFGDNGYSIISYEDMNKFVEVWTIID